LSLAVVIIGLLVVDPHSPIGRPARAEARKRL
jgi:hypothetical protein